MRVLCLALCFLLAGCSLFFRAPVPMRKIATSAGPDARCLVVFLPGFGDDAEVFQKHGFTDGLAQRGIRVDTISADATFGYYTRRNLIDRLETDVLQPAWASRSYAGTWLIGVSMGGMGSLLVAKQDPRITGLLLLAPYLGDDDVFEEIEKAGGLGAWQPPPPGPDDYQRAVWLWLRERTQNPASIPVFLGAGEKDHLGRGHRLLAGALPPDRVYRTPGGHDWGPWQKLWGDFLDHGELTRRCAP